MLGPRDSTGQFSRLQAEYKEIIQMLHTKLPPGPHSAIFEEMAARLEHLEQEQQEKTEMAR